MPFTTTASYFLYKKVIAYFDFLEAIKIASRFKELMEFVKKIL